MKDYKLGNYLYELRKESGLTQEELAYEIGVSDKAISKWENGSAIPTTKNLRKLANSFNVSINELLDIRDKEEDKKIVEIVLTGGPCAGKSTALSWIQNYFTKIGYDVLFVSETATELISSNLAPWTVKENIMYQRCQIKMQLEKEKIYYEGAKYLKNNKVLIVYDRGIMDNLAYMEKREFNSILKEMNLDKVSLRDKYDAILHLQTAAKGAEEFYNLDNVARSEGLEQARILDDKLIDAWKGHPHLRIINNDTNFENKMLKLLKEITVVLGEPTPYEIERKYLIEYPNIKYLEEIGEKVDIVQTYLISNNDEEVRIRQRGSNGNYIYTKTTKKRINDIKRIEIEERLSKDEYLELLTTSDPSKYQVIKSRYNLVYENQYFEIDIYPYSNEYAIMEIELSSELDNVILPDFINVVKEVTSDSRYSNSSIAKSRNLYRQ